MKNFLIWLFFVFLPLFVFLILLINNKIKVENLLQKISNFWFDDIYPGIQYLFVCVFGSFNFPSKTIYGYVKELRFEESKNPKIKFTEYYVDILTYDRKIISIEISKAKYKELENDNGKVPVVMECQVWGKTLLCV